jgi:predicted nucleic acid-binding protein
VDAQSGLIVVDTNIFVIDLRYPRDRHYAANRRFLQKLAQSRQGTTTIFNVLEVCGILSFNLNAQQLQELFRHFSQKYHVQVLPFAELDRPLPILTGADLFGYFKQKASFGDALLMATIATHVPGATQFISWDAAHFRGKLSIPVLTPNEFLRFLSDPP